MHLFIKYVNVTTAGRRVADLVLVIANDTMSEEDFDVQECSCLANGAAIGSFSMTLLHKRQKNKSVDHRYPLIFQQQIFENIIQI